MAKLLVVNADDLGLSTGVNRGIAVAHEKGLVTSTSVMTNLPGFEEALPLLRRLPRLGVGVHLNVTTGHPLGDVHPRLLGRGGEFASPSRLLLAATVVSAIRASLFDELTRQVELALERGIAVTHLDSHHNVHLHPLIRDGVEVVARRFGIGWVRFRDQRPLRARDSGAGPLARLRNHAKLAITDALCRRADARASTRPSRTLRWISGAPRIEVASAKRALAAAVASAGEGISEIACHPGYVDDEARRMDPRGGKREDDLEALQDPELRREIAERGIDLVSYEKLDATVLGR